MAVIFGGRSNDDTILNDLWGLRKHRDGTFDWAQAPYDANLLAPHGR
jgi:protein phosphatase